MSEDIKKRFDEWIRWGVMLGLSLFFAYAGATTVVNALDKRVTIIETRQEQKVDKVLLEQKLKEWKDEIIKEVKDQISKMDTKN
ncbi:MAG: hypothetical protein KKB34_10215 [Bacteroidetes bacterium]|nr:hypothetical protein [Bacteroidota bacterium]